MLTLEKIRKYCCAKKGVIEDFPFDFETLVFKVGTRMFALTNIKSKELRINLKCDPFLSTGLREKYKAVQPGYHMNKRHWNTVYIDGEIPDKEILQLIDHSYDLVFKGLKKSVREDIEKLKK